MNSSNNTATMQVSLSKVGLGYGIAIAVGILVLVSTIMLASYVCVRVHQTSHGSGTSSSAATAAQHSDPGLGAVDASEWATSGLDQVTVESYPKLVYSESQPVQDPSCSICLGDYKDGDMLRMLPECRHMFHAPCIDAWLRLHASCPMCRTSPLPSPLATPISTPLSELIPLARHQSMGGDQEAWLDGYPKQMENFERARMAGDTLSLSSSVDFSGFNYPNTQGTMLPAVPKFGTLKNMED